jgi:hypothetical protein
LKHDRSEREKRRESERERENKKVNSLWGERDKGLREKQGE